MLHKTLGVSFVSLLLLDTAVLAANDGEFQVSSAQTGRYIVKFSASGSSKMKRDGAALDSSSFYTTLGDAGHDASPARSFDSAIFSGVSFDLAGATNMSIVDIQSLPDVEKIWPAALYTLPVSSSAIVTSSPSANASSSSSSSTSEFSTWSAHNDTNVARVQADGYLGDGVVIGIVDTGIDYTHPALGGGFGAGFKVEGGYDLVGDAYEVGGAVSPDDDPMDCLGHGTHVAGIAASIDSIIPGVAPNAKIRSYKVFGCSDGTYEDNIVAAFLMAYEEGVDIISASLGSDQGFPDTAIANVATTISNAGVFVSIAAGNSGSHGPFYSSSGGNGNGQSVAVGSAQAEDWAAFTTTAHSTSGESREIVYLSSDLRQFPIDGTVAGYFPPGARNRTACDWFMPGAPSGDVYIIPRGTCLSQVQDSTLIGLATYVFYVLSSSEFEVPDRAVYSDEQPIGAAAVRYDDGDWLLDQFESGHSVNFTFANDHNAVGIPRASFLSGRINDYSSWGPTLDGRMKPEISAPGGSIMSTWPVSSGSWAVYSGTSMATPYISGVAALFFGSRGGRASLGSDASRIARNRIIGSGAPIYHNDGTDNLANVAKQGAGLVDALKVIEYDTMVQPASINLNDTDHYVGTHNVEITNSGTTSITYQVLHSPGQTALTKGDGDAWVSQEPSYSNEEGYVATVAFSADEITVGPGQTEKLTLSFTEPATIGAAFMPVYGGQVQLIGSNGEVVAVTYMGIKGSIYGSDMWEMARGVPIFFSGSDGLLTEGTNYTFEAGSDVPQPYFNLLWSTRELSIDFVSRDWQPSDWVYPPVASENNWMGSFRLVASPLTGSVVDFPLTNYPRFSGGTYAQPQNVFANGTKIPSGDYMILARTLRTFGDPENIEDWQYKTSAWFRITRDDVVSVSSMLPSSTASIVASSTISSVAASTTTSFACPSANPTEQAVSLIAYVGSATTGHGFYQYSDFLGVDLADIKSTAFTSWSWVTADNGTFHLKTSNDAGNVFATVHTSTNSLVYMYAASSIKGAWSYLECSIDDKDNTVTCVSGTKQYFYICETSDGLVRHGTSVLDGCTALKITAEFVAPDPRCEASASVSSSDLPSSTIVSVSSASASTSMSSFVSVSISTVSSTISSSVSSTSSGVASSSSVSASISVSVSSFVASSSVTSSSAASSVTSSLSLTSSAFTSASASSSVALTTSGALSSVASLSASSLGFSSLVASSVVSSSEIASSTSPSSAVSSSDVSSIASSSAVSSSAVYSSSALASVSSTLASSSTRVSTASVSTGVSSVSSLSATASQPSLPISSASAESTSIFSVESSMSQPAASASASDSSSSAVQTSSFTSNEAYPVSIVSVSTYSGEYTTSTVYATSIATITACPTTIVSCPAKSHTTYVTTVVVAVSTTVCPVTSQVNTGTAAATAAASAATPATTQTNSGQTNTMISSFPYGTGSAIQGPDTTVRITKGHGSTPTAVTTGASAAGTNTVPARVSTETETTLSVTEGAATAPSGSETTASGFTSTTIPASAPSTSTTGSVVTAGASSLIAKGHLLSLLSLLVFFF